MSLIQPCCHTIPFLLKEKTILFVNPIKKIIVFLVIAIFACLAACFVLLPNRAEAQTKTKHNQNLNNTISAKQTSTYAPRNSAGTIYFYEQNKPYYELTNFYENWRHNKLHFVQYQNQNWKTAEHAFQAEKFNDGSYLGQQIRQQIAQASSAREAFNIAQANKNLTRHDWHQKTNNGMPVKNNVMLEILKSKFSDQHLSNVLKKTGSRYLIEDSPVDSYWGCGKDRKGANHLGLLLMQVRKERFGF